VADAVARAGGATEAAELAALNLAAPLVDGVQVLVPSRAAGISGGSAGGEPLPEAGGAAMPGLLGAKLSLSAATAEQLDELPGVGPVTAQKILDYRTEHGPFRSVDDLDAVPGIGPTRIEQLRDLVTP
jgi:competence protein ComEA